jgi:hypothetical protein
MEGGDPVPIPAAGRTPSVKPCLYT